MRGIFFLAAVYALFGFQFGTLAENKAQAVVDKDGTQTAWLTQRLDVFNTKDPRTFQQRYFINLKYAKESEAPVLFYICGESECIIPENILSYAKELGAAVIAVEHRYYGESQPFPTLETKNLEYLTTDRALGDLAVAQDKIKKQWKLNGKWVAFGCSYPGALAAYFRSLYPERVAGAVASSAPVESKTAWEGFEARIAETLGPSCVKKLRFAFQTMKAEMADGSRVQKDRIKEAFGMAKRSDSSVVGPLSLLPYYAVTSGWSDSLCHHLQKASNPVLGLSEFSQLYEKSQGPLFSDPVDSRQLDPSYYRNRLGMRQWFYQMCTEYGFHQVTRPDCDYSFLPQKGIQNIEATCRVLFDIDLKFAEQEHNQRYFERLSSPSKTSNVLFINGERDPWRDLSVLPDGRRRNKNPKNRSIVVPKGGHCSEQYSPEHHRIDPSVHRKVREETLRSVRSWLANERIK